MKKTFNRAIRRAEERLSSPQKTGLEPHLQDMLEKAIITKIFTEKMVAKIEDMTGTRTSVKEPLLEQLGTQMITAGNELGKENPYGATLIKVGDYERRLGKSQRVFFNIMINDYLMPMKAFLEGDMKALMREKTILENKRLDLDSCKKKQRNVDRSKGPKDNVDRAVVIAQAEFDRQKEVVELIANRVKDDEEKHLRLLHKFVEIQLEYFERCYKTISQLHDELTEEIE